MTRSVKDSRLCIIITEVSKKGKSRIPLDGCGPQRVCKYLSTIEFLLNFTTVGTWYEVDHLQGVASLVDCLYRGKTLKHDG